VKSAEPFGKLRRGHSIDPSGYDAGKKIKGEKRHILVDTLGLLLHAVVHPADIQDRNGGLLVLSSLFGLHPFYKSSSLTAAIRGRSFKRLQPKSCRTSKSKSLNAPTRPKGVELLLPRRCFVERTFAWFNRCRRLAKDFGNLNRNALAFLRLALIRLMLRKLCLS
jgi:transposase